MNQNRANSQFRWSNDEAQNAAVWKDIDDAVNAEANSVRVLKKVFMASSAPPEGPVPVEQIDSDTLEITGIGTRNYVQLSVAFSLNTTFIGQEMDRHFGRYKAMEAAVKIALAEDLLFFQGAHAKLPTGVEITDVDQLTQSLLEGIGKDRVVNVKALNGETYGEKTFAGVAKALALLDNSKPENYALFLDPAVYADTYALFASTTGQVSLSDRIKGLVAGGFDKTGALPERTGLLARLNGEPASFYYADPNIWTEYVASAGKEVHFQVCERIQYVVRKPRAFVKLTFEELTGGE